MPKKHTIQKGDSITSLAELHGLFEETIWTHADNAALRDLRPNKNILAPGDVIIIPDLKVKEEKCAADSKHTFKRKGVPAVFRVQLFQHNEPRKKQSYRFDIDGTVVKGTTDTEGILEEVVSPSAKKGVLYIGPKEDLYEFIFGALEPIDNSKGLVQRLQNIGIYEGALDVEADDEELMTAIRAFQLQHKLEPNGEINPETLDTLAIAHDVE